MWRAQFLKALIFLGLVFVVGACAPSAAPTAPSTSLPGGPTPSARAQVIVFSNSKPHVSVIDAETNQIVKTADIPNFTSWTWNDDNNYFDGKNLWVGMRNPDTTEAEVAPLNLDTLEFGTKIPIGKEKLTVYIGKAARSGILHVGKMDSHQVVAIDTKAFKILNTWDVPVNGGVVCDIETGVGSDGVERVFYPTWNGDTVVSINPQTGQTIKVLQEPKGAGPWMNTVAPDGRLWVQEGDANTNVVLDPVTLEVIKRFPTGRAPYIATFSADGRYGFITHGPHPSQSGDTIVQVVDTKSLEEVTRIVVGTNPTEVGVHPNGKVIYAIVTSEASVAVIDTTSWKVTQRISLGTNPAGIFVRTIK